MAFPCLAEYDTAGLVKRVEREMGWGLEWLPPPDGGLDSLGHRHADRIERGY